MRGIPKRLQAAARGEASFAIVMMMASSLGFAKALGLAALLPPNEFGRYISLLGIATFGSILASLGKVEGTIKLYPILFARSKGEWIARHAMRLWIRLLWVVIAASVVFAVVIVILSRTDNNSPLSLTNLAIVAFVTWLIIGLTLTASLVRATTDTRLLQRFTVLRGGLIMALTLPMAILSGSWRLTLLAEGLGMVFVLGIAAFWLRHSLRPEITAPQADVRSLSPETFKGGGTLYFAALLAATIPYGGRTLVLFLSGAAVSGAFGLLTLLVQIGVMLAGALAQKLGPLLIRDASEGYVQPRRLAVPVAFLGALSLLALVVSLGSLLVPGIAAFWASYGIGPMLLMMVSFHLAFQIYLFFRFALIAVHRERQILAATIGAATLCYVGFLISAAMNLGLVGYMASVMASDLFQCIYMTLAYFRFLKRRRSLSQ